MTRNKNIHYNEEETLSILKGDVYIMTTFKCLEVNEKDSAAKGIAKGITDGVLKGSIFWLTVAATLYVGEKLIKEEEIEYEIKGEVKE